MGWSGAVARVHLAAAKRCRAWRWRASGAPGGRLINVYGPTETTVVRDAHGDGGVAARSA